MSEFEEKLHQWIDKVADIIPDKATVWVYTEVEFMDMVCLNVRWQTEDGSKQATDPFLLGSLARQSAAEQTAVDVLKNNGINADRGVGWAED